MDSVNPSSQRVAVVGAGAVGSFFGAMLARAGHAVTLIARAAARRRDRARGPARSSGRAARSSSFRIGASVDLAAVQGADLVLFCVKSTDTEAVAAAIAPHLAEGAIVLSLQNGVENAATIARQVRQLVVPAVVYVATAMPEPGVVKHYGRGDLVIGPMRAADAAEPALAARLQDLVDLFAAAGVPVTISPDVMAELWSKLMVNCAYNAISGLAQQPYGEMATLAVDPRAAARGRAPRSLPWPRPTASTCRWRARSRRWRASPPRCRASIRRLRRTWRAASRARSTISTASSPGADASSASPTPANQALHALVKLVEAKAHG